MNEMYVYSNYVDINDDTIIIKQSEKSYMFFN